MLKMLLFREVTVWGSGCQLLTMEGLFSWSDGGLLALEKAVPELQSNPSVRDNTGAQCDLMSLSATSSPGGRGIWCPGSPHSPQWLSHSNATNAKSVSQPHCKLLFIGSLSLGVASKLKEEKGHPVWIPCLPKCSFLFPILTMQSVTANQIFSQ